MGVIGANKNNVTNSSNYTSGNTYTLNSVCHKRNEIKIQSKIQNEKNDSIKIQSNKNKSQNIAKLLASFVAIVTGASVITVGGNSIIGNNISANFESVYTSENDIFYYVTIDDFKNDTDIYVVLYNDFTNRTQKIEESSSQGVFENLQTNMKYTLAVKKGNKVIASKTVRTIRDDTKEDYEAFEQFENDWEEEYIERGGKDTENNQQNTDPTTQPQTSDLEEEYTNG